MIQHVGIFYNDQAGHSQAGKLAQRLATKAAKQGIRCDKITAPNVE
ncbi:hypothetical protein [Schleiferilactobacillus shenzhenensis]|uniref:Flavodoxin-like domain-containing protein n=1 Tax=Schleiferilactobacillus shenzhenensis LY-73 TaxID=1231336 RepID=U4TXQ9_9LACO|nr:hypothetical protein [Schleiferilactobacillus shenzhenensis]ERL66132.1 hypothetical protein L248_1224 [Schleiferilactobacillus shenzhenensis LY-73]